MPLLTGRVQVGMKIEAVPGTAEVMENGTALAANAEMILANDVTWDPDIAQVARNAAGISFDTAGSTAGVRQAKMSFKANVRGRSVLFAAGTLPDIHLPLEACGCSVTMSGGVGSEIVTVAPVSTITNYYTIVIYNDGIKYLLGGALGNFKLNFTRGQNVVAEFDFTGAYNAPTDVPMRTTGAVPLFAESAPAPPPFLSAAASILGYATPFIESLTFDLGNAITLRGDPNTSSGILTAQITGRTTVGSVDPEAVLVATKNYYSEFLADTAGVITTGTFPSTGTQYNKINLNMPKAKYTKASVADRGGLSTNAIDFECQRNAVTGDDSWSLVFS